MLTIGEVSRRSGVAPSALRFYEERGLIVSVRSAGNQRRFRRDVLRRVAVIQTAQRAGLSLEEIGTLLTDLPADRIPRKDDWAAVARRMQPLLDQRIDALETLRGQIDGVPWEEDDQL
jgi:MerR family redox-sensitive transcriptional activator SoxR